MEAIKTEIRSLADQYGLFVTSQLNVYNGEGGKHIFTGDDIPHLHQFMLQYAPPAVKYEFKTEPFEHQKKVFHVSKDRRNYALFMEMGTGKTKVTLDTAGHLYTEGKIDYLIVFAPNGVHRNWIRECAVHLNVPHSAHYWKSGSKALQREMKQSVEEHGLKVWAFNIEAIITQKCLEMLENIEGPFMIVVDESSRIKNPKAKRTKSLIKLGQYADYRRILTGTPVTQSPLDLYSQFQFLDSTILNYKSFYAFKARYAELKNPALLGQLARMFGTQPATEYYKVKQKGGWVSDAMINQMNPGRAGQVRKVLNSFPMFIESYTNMEELHSYIDPHSFRVLKKDCLDLPDKLYQIEYVELSGNQRRVYNEVKEGILTEFKGAEMTTQHLLTQLLRLQQVTGGFFSSDEGIVMDIDELSPKLERTREIVEGLSADASIIIWARFTAEIEALAKLLEEHNPVLYYGAISSDERERGLDRFRKRETRVFIGNQSAGGIGLNLTEANYMLYYSNTFSLEDRLQSEDRAHRIGQKKNVNYIDLISPATLDEKVHDALREKKNISDVVLQEKSSFLS